MIGNKAFAFLSCLVFSLTRAMHSDSGYIVTMNSTIKTNSYSLNGTMKAYGSSRVEAKEFSGSGNMQSDSVSIVCDEFKFTGTITCNGKCMIYVKKPFDYTLFRRKGTGSFTVIVSPYEARNFTQSQLCSEAQIILSTGAVDDAIKQIRACVALNDLDEQSVFNQIKADLQQKIEHHGARVYQKRDSAELKKTLMLGSATLGGLGASGAVCWFKDALMAKFPTMKMDNVITFTILGVGLSCVPLTYLPSSISGWLNPRHQEKFDAYVAIKNTIEAALLTPRVVEETIIKLQ